MISDYCLGSVLTTYFAAITGNGDISGPLEYDTQSNGKEVF
jgi:hypothetical protein